MTGLDAMHQLAWLALRRNEIEPAPAYQHIGAQSQYAIGNGVAMMVVVEQPGIKFLLTQRGLNFF